MDSELLTCHTPESAPEDWQCTLPSVQQMILQIAQRLGALEQEVSTLRAENERLREQTRRSSRNSSQPPIGEGLLEQARRLFEWWHRVRDGTLARAASSGGRRDSR